MFSKTDGCTHVVRGRPVPDFMRIRFMRTGTHPCTRLVQYNWLVNYFKLFFWNQTNFKQLIISFEIQTISNNNFGVINYSINYQSIILFKLAIKSISNNNERKNICTITKNKIEIEIIVWNNWPINYIECPYLQHSIINK